MAGATANALDPDTASDARAAAAPVTQPPTFTPRSPVGKITREPKEPEVTSQTVRFTEREKNALLRLAHAEKRSEHFIIKEILGPALLARAARLDEKTAAE